MQRKCRDSRAACTPPLVSASRELLTDVTRLNESRGQRIVWLLEELKLDYDIKVYFRQKDKHSPPELKQVHPLGKSPAISIQAPSLQNEKPLVLAESAAIVEYVSDHFGQKLIPKRYPDGKDGLIGAETKEWLRFRVSAIIFAVEPSRDP